MKGTGPLVKLFLEIFSLIGFAVLVQHFLHINEKFFRESKWDPQLVLKKVTVVGWEQGKRIWRFRSDELQVDHQGRLLTYRGKGVGEVFRDNKVFLAVWAPQMRFDMMTKSVQAVGGVFLKGQPSFELTAEKLFWNQYTQRLYVPGEVYVRSTCGKAWAHNLILTAFNGQLRVSGVRTIFSPGILRGIPTSLSQEHDCFG